jgi:hypothetical protein
MALVSRFNGAAAAGAFYGYQPLVIRLACTGGFTVNTGGAGAAIVDGGFERVVRAVQQLGSIVWLGAQNDDSLTVIVDGPTFNAGPGATPTTTGAYGALKDVVLANRTGTGALTVTTSSVLNGNGTFTFA